MNKYIVTLADGSKVEVPTELTIGQMKVDLIAKKIAFKSVSTVSLAKWERKFFSSRKEAMAYQIVQKKGQIKAQGNQWVWFAAKS